MRNWGRSLTGPVELSVVLCDDAHIQELNRKWRGKDAPTDVLSFELDDEDEFSEVRCAPPLRPPHILTCSSLRFGSRYLVFVDERARF